MLVVVVAGAVIVIIVLDAAAAVGAAPFECQRRRSDSIVLRQGTADAPRIARFEVNKQFCKATAGAQPLSAARTARKSGVRRELHLSLESEKRPGAGIMYIGYILKGMSKLGWSLSRRQEQAAPLQGIFYRVYPSQVSASPFFTVHCDPLATLHTCILV